MRDHKRRTEIRLIVIGEDAGRIKEGIQREQAHPDGEGRESARYWIALHVQRFLFFSNLPPEFREVVILRELEELSYREIAEITALPIGTVMSRLSRARERLRAQWERQQAQEERHGP